MNDALFDFGLGSCLKCRRKELTPLISSRHREALRLRVRTGRTQPVTRRVGSPFSQPTTDPFSISLTRKNSKLFFQSKIDKCLWISPIKSNSANISFLLDLIFMISSIYKRHIDIITLFLLSTTIIYSTLTHGSMTHGLGQPKQHSEGHWPNPTHLPISWPIRTLILRSEETHASG